MRLIDADALLKEMATFKDDRAINGVSVAVAIARCSTIDPVHAAGGCYCRECKHYENFRPMWCDLYCDEKRAENYLFYGNDFCSYGRREESRCEKD